LFVFDIDSFVSELGFNANKLSKFFKNPFKTGPNSTFINLNLFNNLISYENFKNAPPKAAPNTKPNMAAVPPTAAPTVPALLTAAPP
jgi:hypothetical protein